MKEYHIEYKGWDSLKEDIRDDFAFFNCQVYPKADNEKPFELSLPFHKMKQHLEKINPEVFLLLQKAAKRITKRGVHNSDIIRELEDYGIDLGAIVIEIIEQTVDLEKEAIRQASLRENPPRVNEILNDLQNITHEMKKDSTNYNLICTGFENVLTNKIVDMFPVIINSSPDNIRKLHSILVRHIPGLANELCELINEAEENQLDG